MPTVAEWMDLYVAEHRNQPESAPQFYKYIQNRNGDLTYREVREAFQLARRTRPEVIHPKSGERKVAADISHWRRVDGFDKEDCCAICLADNNDDCVELDCGGHHRFHLACMSSLVATTFKPECPICRGRYAATGVCISLPSASSADAAHGGTM